MNSARPTRSSSAGSAYLDLRKLSRRSGRPTDELHQLYALEGFSPGSSNPPYADRLILKGGVLLGGSIQLLGYPLPMVLAEKIVTAVQRGSANTRWRDYADIYLLSNRHEVDTDQLQAAITTVANHRRAVLIPLRQILDDYALRAQQRWAAWRRKQRLDDRLPESFGDLLESVITFTDPALTTTTISQRKKTELTAEQPTPDGTAPTPPESGEHPGAG